MRVCRVLDPAPSNVPPTGVAMPPHRELDRLNGIDVQGLARPSIVMTRAGRLQPHTRTIFRRPFVRENT